MSSGIVTQKTKNFQEQHSEFILASFAPVTLDNVKLATKTLKEKNKKVHANRTRFCFSSVIV